LKQRLGDREVLPDELVPKGSMIDIVSGDGLGIVSLQSPNLIGLDEESARVAIVGSGLKVGEVVYQDDGQIVNYSTESNGELVTSRIEISPGAVYKQTPLAGNTLRLKASINLWIYRPDSINTRPTLLDE